MIEGSGYVPLTIMDPDPQHWFWKLFLYSKKKVRIWMNEIVSEQLGVTVLGRLYSKSTQGLSYSLGKIGDRIKIGLV